MILSLLTALIMRADCEYQLSAKWRAFKERHIIADDPYDELTQKLKREEEERKKREEEEK